MIPCGLRVMQPGLHTTVQDLGRVGAQHLGIPVSGALDPLALRAANVVVGNPQAMAGLEIAVLGPTFEVTASCMRIAVAGQGSHLTIETAAGAHRAIPALQSTRLVEGDRFRVIAASRSAVSYLAIEGGLALPPVLGSLSTYARGGFGGFEGRALAAGDCLPLALSEIGTRTELCLPDFDLSPATEVRVVLGPQADYFTPAAIEVFLAAPYTVTQDADRMGLRLEGSRLDHAKGYNIVSDGTAPGSIQVPGNGQPIVLLADRQTTGGYPKIATVISADLPALGRVLPLMTVQFRRVSVAEAHSTRRTLETAMASLVDRLVEACSDGPDLDRLYDANLISGVAHAMDIGTWRYT